MTVHRLVRWIGLATVLVAAPVAHTAETKDARLFLWRIQSKATTVHLLGSIHVAKPELYPLDTAIEEAFARSSALVVEADVTTIDEPQIQKIMVARGRYPQGETLETHLSATHIDRLKRYLSEREMLSYDVIKPMRPWLASVVLGALELERLGYQPEHGIDMHFLTQAKASEKTILELESTRFQLDLFSSFRAELEELLLVYQIEQTDDIGEQAEDITRAWRDGDAAAIEAIFGSYTEDDSSFAPLMKVLLDDRNVAMAKKIRGYLEDPERSYFVVVGAGHLVGERGLIALLDDPVFQVEQVAASPAEPVTVD